MKLPSSRRLAVLLASASAGGTIAAVRQLAESAIEVGVVSSRHFSAASWSNRASHCYSAPPENDTRGFLNRLIEIGKGSPGQILLPTSDELAWLYTANAELLARQFCVYQPSIACIKRILDKKLFEDAATSAGLTVLPSWDPKNLEELEALAPKLPYPVLIKPRTHVHRLRNDKGVVVCSPEDLIRQYRLYLNRQQYRGHDPEFFPRGRLPIVQQFAKVGNEGVHSITGFIDRTGDLFVTRRSVKVFQRFQPVGVGVCFELLPPAPELSQAVRQLCRELKYFGIFEVEFVWSDGRWATIDFNPRIYNQLGMDIRRGMPLPLLACLEAAGERAALEDAVTKAQMEETPGTVFWDGFTLRAILLAQAVTSRTSREDRKFWRAWIKKNAAHAVDVAADRSDPMPGIVHALSEAYLGVRAIPPFLRVPGSAGHLAPNVSQKVGS